MAFKIRDLMISSLSEGGAKISPQEPTAGCCHPPTARFGPCFEASLTGPRGLTCITPTLIYPTITFPTCHPPTLVCFPTFLGFCTNNSAGVAEASAEASHAALAALKEQLKQQLAEVERQQAAVEESLRPQTVEQVDELTKKLTEALEELKARRQELSKKRKSKG